MLTIVIPTIGRGKTFDRAISSAVKSGVGLVSSIIIVNNSQSYDFSIRINHIVATINDHRLSVIAHSERVSMSASWNSSLKLIKTEWVLFLHDDDELLDINLLSELIKEKLNQNKKIGFLTFNFYYQFKKIPFMRSKRAIYRWPDLTSIEMLLNECPKFVSTIINVEQLRQINGFSDEYGYFMDLIVFVELFKNANAKSIPISLGIYHIHDGNESDLKKRGTAYGNFIPAVCKRFFDLYEDNQKRRMFISSIIDFVYPQKKNVFSRLLIKFIKMSKQMQYVFKYLKLN
jgi:glycosyltransferase involved in cell wall biosynthesis